MIVQDFKQSHTWSFHRFLDRYGFCIKCGQDWISENRTAICSCFKMKLPKVKK